MRGSRGCSVDSLEMVGRVEVLQIEQPQLVQPCEVIVSGTVCIEKLEKPLQPTQQLVQQLIPQQSPAAAAIFSAGYGFLLLLVVVSEYTKILFISVAASHCDHHHTQENLV